MIPKISLALTDKSFSFLAKKPFQILAERRLGRREAPSLNLQNPDWRAILNDVRTYFQTTKHYQPFPILSKQTAVLSSLG